MRHAPAADTRTGTRRGVTAERISATVARIMTKVMVSGIGMASEIRSSGRESETETGIKAEKGEATGTVIKMQNSADISTSTGIATDIALVPPPAHPPRARGKLQPCFCLASHSQGKLQLVRFVQSRCVCVDTPLSFKSQQILANSAQKRNEAKNEGSREEFHWLRVMNGQWQVLFAERYRALSVAGQG